MSYESFERIAMEEYGRVIRGATVRYGLFTPPEIYIPKLDEKDWEAEFLPPRMKFYGVMCFPKYETPFMALNTWAFVRELELLGETHVRRKLRVTLSHELIHQLYKHWPEIEINIETERLVATLEG